MGFPSGDDSWTGCRWVYALLPLHRLPGGKSMYKTISIEPSQHHHWKPAALTLTGLYFKRTRMFADGNRVPYYSCLIKPIFQNYAQRSKSTENSTHNKTGTRKTRGSRLEHRRSGCDATSTRRTHTMSQLLLQNPEHLSHG